jgi:hypothetical protein
MQQLLLIGGGPINLFYAINSQEKLTIVESRSTDNRLNPINVENIKDDLKQYLNKLKDAGIPNIILYTTPEDEALEEREIIPVNDLLEKLNQESVQLPVYVVQGLMKNYIEHLCPNVKIITGVDASKARYEFYPEKKSGVMSYVKKYQSHNIEFKTVIDGEGTKRDALTYILSHSDEYKGKTYRAIREDNIFQLDYKENNNASIYMRSNQAILEKDINTQYDKKLLKEEMEKFGWTKDIPSIYISALGNLKTFFDSPDSNDAILILLFPEEKRLSITGPIPQHIKTQKEVEEYFNIILKYAFPNIYFKQEKFGAERYDMLTDLASHCHNQTDLEEIIEERTQLATKLDDAYENNPSLFERFNKLNELNGFPFSASFTFTKGGNLVRGVPILNVGDTRESSYYQFGEGLKKGKQSAIDLEYYLKTSSASEDLISRYNKVTKQEQENNISNKLQANVFTPHSTVRAKKMLNVR